ncbi:HlyIII-domain-containing protein [Xylariomycetidae sp. FL2044]|nr:HlyIII-domain-containing protein [Xylariomycetidae sp. FL2044]
MAKGQRIYPHELPVGRDSPETRDIAVSDQRSRQASSSYAKSVQSAFTVHNETANIWSHLLGTVIFLLSLYRCLESGMTTTASMMRTPDILALGLYISCVAVCFLLSAAFHTFSDHSQEVHKLGHELDHLGIVLVIWGTGVSGAYFAFYCERSLRWGYSLAITLAALGCGVLTLRPEFRQPTYRTMRSLTHWLLGASLFAPVAHGLWLFGGREFGAMMGLESFLSLALINSLGGAVYAARIPERWSSGYFDLLGHSHNWMHILAFLGAVVRLRGLMVVASRWQLHPERDGTCL